MEDERFEWDDTKALENARKHRVTFNEAKTAFYDVRAEDSFDEQHSTAEDRFVLLGQSDRFRILVVSYTERANLIRIISARLASRLEIDSYYRRRHA